MKKRELISCGIGMLLLTVSLTACGTENNSREESSRNERNEEERNEEEQNEEEDEKVYEYEDSFASDTLSIIKSTYSEDCLEITFEGDGIDSSYDIIFYDRNSDELTDDFDVDWEEGCLTITGNHADDICNLYLSKSDGENFLCHNIFNLNSDQFDYAGMPDLDPVETTEYIYEDPFIDENLSITSATYWDGGLDISINDDFDFENFTIIPYDSNHDEIALGGDGTPEYVLGYDFISLQTAAAYDITSVAIISGDICYEIYDLNTEQFTFVIGSAIED